MKQTQQLAPHKQGQHKTARVRVHAMALVGQPAHEKMMTFKHRQIAHPGLSKTCRVPSHLRVRLLAEDWTDWSSAVCS